MSKKEQLQKMLAAAHYSPHTISWLTECDVERLPDRLRITAPRGTAQDHQHFLCCDLSTVTGLPVELVLK